MHQQRTRRQRKYSSLADDANDYYARLGVSETASAEQVKRGYRAAMKRIHPDRVKPGERLAAETEAKAVNQAFRTLSNPALKRQYDAQRKGNAVQDQVMNRYFGGMGRPGSENDICAQIRQAAMAEQRQQQKQHDRTATASLMLVFGGLLAAVVLAVVLWGIVSAIAGRMS